MKAPGTKEILDKALEMETGSELYITCKTSTERNCVYSDLRRRRLWLIKDDHLVKYESVIIEKGLRNDCNAVILTKIDFKLAYIKKSGSTPEEAAF